MFCLHSQRSCCADGFACLYVLICVPAVNKAGAKTRGRLFQQVGLDAAKDTKELPAGIIGEDSSFRWWWDIALMIILLLFAVLSPWSAAFAPGTGEAVLPWVWLAFFWMCDLVAWTDTYLRLRHFSFRNEHGEAVTDQSVIMWTYFSSRECVLDFVGNLPLDICIFVLTNSPTHYIYFVRLNRVVLCRRLPLLISALQQYIETHAHLNQHLLRIGGLALLFLYFTHVVGCVLYFIGWYGLFFSFFLSFFSSFFSSSLSHTHSLTRLTVFIC
jgi:hypothetical protein